MAIFSYIVIWHISLFVLLPVRGVPLKRKLWWNSALAAVLTLGVHLLLRSGAIPLRNAL